MNIYIDRDFKCHTESAAGRTAVETGAFTGKCRQYIEGYRFVPSGQIWTREDGQVFRGEMIAPWRDYAVLAEFQALYEEEQAKQVEAQEALNILLEGEA